VPALRTNAGTAVAERLLRGRGLLLPEQARAAPDSPAALRAHAHA
jgi:hypothetical protein